MDDTTGSDPKTDPNTEKTDQDGNAGQVSETASEFGEEISSGDSVAGQPDPHPGEVDEGAQGPNAIPDDPTGEHPHKP